MSSNIIPMEMKGYYTDDKIGVFSDQRFQWKVDITDIQSNFQTASWAWRNKNANRR